MGVRPRIRVALPAFVAAGILLTVAACGGGSAGPAALASERQASAPGAGASPSGSSSNAPACTDAGAVSPGPAAEASPIVHSSDAINVLGGRELLPAGIPIPPGVTVGQVLLVRGVSYTAVLEVTDPNAAYAYLLKALPSSGYAIDLCERTPQQAGVGFTGKECGKDSAFTLSAASNSLVCDLGGM